MGVEELLRFVGTMLAVVGGVVLTGRLLRRARVGRPEAIRVVARVGLSRSAALHLVLVGGRSFLIGTGDQGPRILAELDAEEADLALRSGSEGRALPALGPGTGLVETLRQATLRRSGRSHAAHR